MYELSYQVRQDPVSRVFCDEYRRSESLRSRGVSGGGLLGGVCANNRARRARGAVASVAGRLFRQLGLFASPLVEPPARGAPQDIAHERGSVEFLPIHDESGRHLLSSQRTFNCHHSHGGADYATGPRLGM